MSKIYSDPKSGTIQFVPEPIEYAYNSSTSTSDDTSSFSFGTIGAPIKAFTSPVTKRVRCNSVINQSDDYFVELKENGIWTPYTGNPVAGVDPFTRNGISACGITLEQVSATDIDVVFCQYRSATWANFGDAGSAWADIADTVYWRLVKKSNGVIQNKPASYSIELSYNISATNKITDLTQYELNGSDEKQDGFTIKTIWTSGTGSYSHSFNTSYTIGGYVASKHTQYYQGYITLKLNHRTSNWEIVAMTPVHCHWKNQLVQTAAHIKYQDIEVDTHKSGSTVSDNWRFTVPIDGTYQMNALVTNGTNTEIQLYKNGVFFSSLGDNATREMHSISFQALSGEYFTLRAVSYIFSADSVCFITFTKTDDNQRSEILSNSSTISEISKDISSTSQTTSLSVYETNGLQVKTTGWKVKINWLGGITYNHSFTTGYTINGEAASSCIGYGSGFLVLELDQENANWKVVQDGRELVYCRYSSQGGAAVGANVILNYATKISDIYNTVTTGTSWKFTAPKKMMAMVVAMTVPSVDAGTDYISKNGTMHQYGNISGHGGSHRTSTWIMNLEKDDYIDIRDTSGLSASNNNYFTVTEIPYSSRSYGLLNSIPFSPLRPATKNILSGVATTNLSVYELGGSSEKQNGFQILVSWSNGTKAFNHSFTTGYSIGGLTASSWVGYGTGSITLELDKTNGNWIVRDSGQHQWDTWVQTASSVTYTYKRFINRKDCINILGVAVTTSGSAGSLWTPSPVPTYTYPTSFTSIDASMAKMAVKDNSGYAHPGGFTSITITSVSFNIMGVVSSSNGTPYLELWGVI